MIVLHSLSEGAGVAGFFMAAGSLLLHYLDRRHALGQPAREEQRNERYALRDLLFAVKQDLETAINALGFARGLEPEPAPSLAVLQNAIPRYAGILKVPTSKALWSVSESMELSQLAWKLVGDYIEDSNRDDPILDKPGGRRLAALEARARETLQRSLSQVDGLIEVINAANRE